MVLSFGTVPATGSGHGNFTSLSSSQAVSVNTGGGFPPLNAAAATTNPQNAPPVQASDYESIFHGRRIFGRLSSLVRDAQRSGPDDGRRSLADQELRHVLDPTKDLAIGGILLAPKLPPYFAPNVAFRQQMYTQRKVLLSRQEEAAPLNEHILREIFDIADALKLPEHDAIALFATANQPDTPAQLAEYLSINPDQTGGGILALAQKLFLLEHDLVWRALSLLMQTRAGAARSVVEATDALLQQGLFMNLLSFLRESTMRIQTLREQLVRAEANLTAPAIGGQGPGGYHSTSTGKDKTVTFLEFHLDLITAHRQYAAECLFFIAYHTQLNAEEVGGLVDVIRDLTNGNGRDDGSSGLPLLDPVHHIPSAYETPSALHAAIVAAPWMVSPQPPLAPQLKDASRWRREMVEDRWRTGQPQLLRCVSILVMTVLSALGARETLWDRYAHQENSFGRGNALLPPGSGVTAAIASLHEKLGKAAVQDWQRTDILGVLMASYAMLLRSSPLALSSPRNEPQHAAAFTRGSIDVRKAWRECMEAPTELKAFSFARVSLLPALRIPLRNPESNCDVAEFLLSVLAEFASNYLEVLSASGDRPISRAKWRQDAEEDLLLRRSHIEQQRQFQAWSGTKGALPEDVPDSVDLLKRPDCMDDVIAFAISVCSLGRNYALKFWSVEEAGPGEDEPQTKAALVPSQALRELDSQHQDDESLRPCYLTFLAALALAKDEERGFDGALAVHQMLLREPDADARVHTNWPVLLEVLRWYVQNLGPQDYAAAPAASKGGTRTDAQSGGSTAYYYFADGDGGSASSYGVPETSMGENIASMSTQRELDDENTFILLSHLAVISNVASNCPASRLCVLSTNLPIRTRDGRVIGQDSPLNLLFTLAVMPLTPDVRGAVFATISRLICADGLKSDEDLRQVRVEALKSWELLESCLVLPIHMLDQYPSIRENDIPSVQGLCFPPSSSSVASRGVLASSWIPADPKYSIIYEMEYVEAPLGVYRSTEGFLRLLTSLFKVGGWPATLGRNWRLRCGCTPYIEYVVNLILPRLSGDFKGLPELPCRSSEDRDRLYAHTLEVVEAVLVRYMMPINLLQAPASEKEFRELVDSCRSGAQQELGHTVGAAVVVAPHLDDLNSCLEDFRAKPNDYVDQKGTFASELDAAGRSTPQHGVLSTIPAVASASLPRPKSPGFAILSELLSPTRRSLLNALVTIITKRDGQGQVLDSDRMALSNALFGTTQPRFSARAQPIRQSLIESLQPAPDTINSFELTWRERAVLLALRLICAALVREKPCAGAFALFPNAVVVPVLLFQAKSSFTSRQDVINVQLTSVSQLLASSDVRTSVISSLIDLIAYHSFHDDSTVDIASAAGSIVFYMERDLEGFEGLDQFRRFGRKRSDDLAGAFGRRLVESASRLASKRHADLTHIILDRMLFDLRKEEFPETSLSQVMLGLPSANAGGLWAPGRQPSRSPRDCFDSILRLLNEQEVLSSSTVDGAKVAASCFEILFRLITLSGDDSNALRRVLYSSERLRALDFWRTQLLRINSLYDTTRGGTGYMYAIHSMAWLLKGTAVELHLLGGFGNSPEQRTAYDILLAPRPSQCMKLLSVLLEDPYAILIKALRMVPMEKRTHLVSFTPSEGGVRASKMKHFGPDEVAGGYELVDCAKLIELSKGSAADEEGIRYWCDVWNDSVSRDCASAHLSAAIHVVVASSCLASRRLTMSFPTGPPGCKLLFQMLSRMTLLLDSGHPLDDAFYTTATRNIALAVLKAADQMLYDTRFCAAELPMACSLLAKAVVCSDPSRTSVTDLSRASERTALFAGALTLVLTTLPAQELTALDQDDFFRAGIVLSRLVDNVPSGTASVYLPSVLAQSCLVALSNSFDKT